jgi:glyoxylase I family protein
LVPVPEVLLVIRGPGVDSELLRLERALAERDAGAVAGGLVALLTDDFLEIGRSGKVWTKASIAALLERPEPAPVPPFEHVRVEELAPGLHLVTYRGALAMRASIWVWRDGRWQMRFHQGTPLAGDGGILTSP